MINKKLRKEWGFDGFVVSDCDAISDVATQNYIHRVFNTTSLLVQAQQALRGGTDVNCGTLYGSQNVEAVKKGLIHETELDRALIRVYTKSFQLGIFDQFQPNIVSKSNFDLNPYIYMGATDVDTPAARTLALEGALQGQVLLKNVDNRLPLSTSIKKLALIGPHANSSFDMLGGQNYHGINYLVKEYTPLLRAQAMFVNSSISYAAGASINDKNDSQITEAVAVAADADVVILFVGTDGDTENEGHDREDIGLPGVQEELALSVANASRTPIVVVLINGGTLAIGKLKRSNKVGAILESFLPGQFAGEAIMQLLLGDVSPSGLMPVTVYDEDFIERRSIYDLDLRGQGGVTYRYFDGTPLWPFGFGLSYAKFEFSGNSSSTLHTTVATAGSKSLCFKIDVTNIHTTITSDVVVLGFVHSNHTDAPRNPKICDFARLAAVAPGTQRSVNLCVDALGAALALVNQNGEQRVLPGSYTMSAGVQGGVGGTGAGSVIGTIIVST